MKRLHAQYDLTEWSSLNLLGAHLVMTTLGLVGVLLRTALQVKSLSKPQKTSPQRITTTRSRFYHTSEPHRHTPSTLDVLAPHCLRSRILQGRIACRLPEHRNIAERHVSPRVGDPVHLLPGQAVRHVHVPAHVVGDRERLLANGARRLPRVLLHVLGEVPALGVGGAADGAGPTVAS